MLRKRRMAHSFDCERMEPVIRCSICTGEQVACLRDRESGHLEEIMLIRDARDLEAFCSLYGIEKPVRKIY